MAKAKAKEKLKSLVIVESPAKAKTIEKYLGKANYNVVASIGHVRDLPKSKLGVDIENNFEPHYINIRGKGELIKSLRNEAKKSKRVYLASDPDREGEAIAWHLQTALNINPDEECRVTFNEITKEAIKEAIKSPRQIDMALVDAQQGRRVLDRIVGYKLSPLLWRKVKKGLSAGRVQSVALRLICEREAEIDAFEPEEYWSLETELKKGKSTFSAKLGKYKSKKIHIETKEDMDKILEDLKNHSYVVDKVAKSKRTKKPPVAFTTSTLQQDAYKKLNFTAKKTMRLAQALYEGISLGKEGNIGLITYMRTDSTRLSDTAKLEASAYISEHYGEAFLLENQQKLKAKATKVQDAHEAIRPTAASRDPEYVKEYLSRDEFRLYELIWKRFIASQMAPAMFDHTVASISAGDYQFNATGMVQIFEGYLKVYQESKDSEKDKSLPKLLENDVLVLVKELPKQHFTQPPARYTEASIIKMLEEKGIGRPSTYVATIETLVFRNYIVRENKQFYPTEIGNLVNSLLVTYFNEVVNSEFTANMEDKLDKIEEGQVAWQNVIGDFYDVFDKLLEKAEDEIGEVKIEDEVSDEICEKCGKPFLIKMGRYGKFLACSSFPECRNAKPLLEKINVICPECGKGEIVIRRSKKGRIFYGCNLYPSCEYTSWQKPTGHRCPECQVGHLVEKMSKKGNQVVCDNPSCHYKEVKEDE